MAAAENPIAYCLAMHTINLDAVIQSEYPEVIRNAAKRLQQAGYMDVGTFLKELSKEELDTLNGYCSAITVHKDHGTSLDCIVLLGEMLAQAEGTPLDHPDVGRTANLIILLTFEDLARKNIIEFLRENATLGEDLVQASIARLK